MNATRLPVLLAEDDPMNQLFVEAVLGDLVDLVVVGDGASALLNARARAFDLILMDIRMPVMDGLAAIRAIRAWEAGFDEREAYIVALTGEASAESLRAIQDAGADAHLAKPFGGDELIALARLAMGRGARLARR